MFETSFYLIFAAEFMNGMVLTCNDMIFLFIIFDSFIGECIGIAELTDAGDDMSSVLFGISTDALDADLARKQEEGLLDDPLLQALFRDMPFAQRLIDRGRIIHQKIPIINATLKNIERVKYGMVQELCHKMDIEEEDMVVTVT